MFSEVITTALLYIGFLFSYLEYRWRRVRNKACRWSDVQAFIFDGALTNASTPDRISDYIRSTFTYRMERRRGGLRINYGSHPLVFLKDLRGDCESFAVFTECVLSRLAFTNISRVYAVTKAGTWHTVAIAKIGNFHYAFGHWPVIVLSSNELSDVGKIIALGLKEPLDFAIRARYNVITEFYIK